MCGEKGTAAIADGVATGSPPRVRGKEGEEYQVLTNIRITPACAGKRLKKALKNKDF